MTAQDLTCPSCQQAMRWLEQESHPDGGLDLQVYQCANPSCLRKACLVWWELQQGMSPGQRSWVEEQVMRRGSFFPSDFTR